MLKKILDPASCASCRVCCGFDKDDKWEIPVISKELLPYVKYRIPNARLEEFNGEYRFAMEFDCGGAVSFCPALGEDGCVLGDSKPFDCRVWPLRIMRISDDVVGITVSPVCETVSNLPLSVLSGFVHEGSPSIAQIMYDYAKEHPAVIKSYISGYPILDVLGK